VRDTPGVATARSSAVARAVSLDGASLNAEVGFAHAD
jgi:hypothetical protein